MKILKKLEKLTEFINKENILYNEKMSRHTTFKIGGEADVIVTPEKEEEIIDVIKYARAEGIAYHIIGNGSNLLCSDAGIQGIVIKLCKNFSDISVMGEYVSAKSGALLSKVSSVAMQHGLKNMEFASGIPGTIGGAVFMNAGAYGGEMRDIVVKVKYLDENLEYKTAEEFGFGYRSSIFQKNGGIILSVDMKLQKGNKEEIKEQMEELSRKRKEKQPVNMPSAGSAFKRPEGHFAAKLIDDCGLRGYKIGDAAVSEKHTGFVVNLGNATAEDVKNLLGNVRDIVHEKTGVLLEKEIKFIGEFK